MGSQNNIDVYYRDSSESARSELWFSDKVSWVGFVESATQSKSPKQSYITLYEQDGGDKPKATDEKGHKLYETRHLSVDDAVTLIRSYMNLFKINDYDKRFVFFFLRDIKTFYKLDSDLEEKIKNVMSDLNVNPMYLSHSKWLW